MHFQETSRPEDTLIYSVVGLHAITVPQDAMKLRRDRLDALTSLLAIGIDPKRSILFLQEDVRIPISPKSSTLTNDRFKNTPNWRGS